MTLSGILSGSRAARGRSCGRWEGRNRAAVRARRSPAILPSGFYGRSGRNATLPAGDRCPDARGGVLEQAGGDRSLPQDSQDLRLEEVPAPDRAPHGQEATPPPPPTPLMAPPQTGPPSL